MIGITGNFAQDQVSLQRQYFEAVVRAGGVPVVIPPVSDVEVIVNTLDSVDALLLSGGGDINPLFSGEEPKPKLHTINGMRDEAELLTVRLAFNRQLPMLGICRGIQLLASALDGKVEQDIEITKDSVKHSQETLLRSEPTHTVEIEQGSLLESVFKQHSLAVNSFHHQAVRAAGRLFNVSARAKDGVIEALESAEEKPIIGVQWHPEWLQEAGEPLFAWLVREARLFSEAKRLHRSIVTLDSHVDTPMFFPQYVDFLKRDERILVDAHKMREGMQSATIMACYLPQMKEGEKFQDCVSGKGLEGFLARELTPKAYCDAVFSKIEDIAKRQPQYFALAKTAEDVRRNKRQGKISLLRAIENGIALEHDVDNVAHFKRLGAVYITLCHNGDNDICDSARGKGTWQGVSPFGEKVIERMNQEGVIVDLSHASRESFFDALEISQKPVACSHSCTKALCDVPRNLDDEQMRALVAKDGVMQLTLYHGFLRSDDRQATILDFIDHLNHAIDIMGVEHVGIGTDFDGDGGVCGLADSSEMIQLTMHLLRRRFSKRDIQMIWGGSWLRLMDKVQS